MLICASHKNYYGMEQAISTHFVAFLEFLACATKPTQIPHKHLENQYIMKHVGYSRYRGIVLISLPT